MSKPRSVSDKRSLNRFWQAAFLAAELPLLAERGVNKISPEGAAHLASDFADAAVREYQVRRSR